MRRAPSRRLLVLGVSVSMRVSADGHGCMLGVSLYLSSFRCLCK